jgi:peptidoglycan/LPS O-acetylase OafA/YrhL
MRIETLTPTADRATGRPPTHLAFIDALRGYAILGVILFHVGQLVPDAHPWLAGPASLGATGVQLFFVVSAFTLFRSLHARATVDRRPMAAFFARRFFRIVPLFWVGVLFYVGHPDAWRPMFAPSGVGLPHVLVTLALVHTWYPTTFNSVVPGGWSVGIEAMFYLTVPFLYRHVRSLNTALALTVASGLAAAVATPALNAVMVHRFPPDWAGLIGIFTSVLFPMQFVVFCAGILLHLILAGRNAGGLAPLPLPRASPSAVVLLLAGVLVAVAPRQVVAAATFTLLAWGLAVRPFPVLVHPAIAFVGRVSYSAYLWHFCVLDQVAARLLPYLRAAWGPGTSAGTRRLAVLYVAVVAATLPVAWASYRLIELPFIALGKWLVAALGWGPPPRRSTSGS